MPTTKTTALIGKGTYAGKVKRVNFRQAQLMLTTQIFINPQFMAFSLLSGDLHMAATFVDTIKPYFTPCYRAHMLGVGVFDLWSQNDVKTNWQDIYDRVNLPAGNPGRMPKAGCPEGVWDDQTRQQFLTDFQDWKTAGYP
jgi:hypothetical protein